MQCRGDVRLRFTALLLTLNVGALGLVGCGDDSGSGAEDGDAGSASDSGPTDGGTTDTGATDGTTGSATDSASASGTQGGTSNSGGTTGGSTGGGATDGTSGGSTGGGGEPSWGDGHVVIDAMGTCRDPDVAIGGTGDAIAVYTRNDRPYAKRFDAGTGMWDASPTSLATAAGLAMRTQVAMDPAGDGFAAFELTGPGGPDIPVAAWDSAGASWGGEAPVDTSDSDMVSHPRVGMAGNGDAIVVWTQGSGGSENVYASHYDAAGSTWGAPVTVDDNAIGATSVAEISVAQGGDAAVVYTLAAAVWVNLYDAGNDSWGTPHKLGDSSLTGGPPSVTMDDQGDVTAAWAEFQTTRFDLHSSRYDASGSSWSTPEPRETDDTGTAISAHVAATPSGDAILVWTQDFGGEPSIYSSWYDAAGDSWSDPTLVEQQATTAGAAWVDIADDGDAVVAWREDLSQTNWVIWVNTWDAASKTWGAEIEQDSTINGGYKPRVAVHPNGDAALIWIQQDDSGVAQVWANNYR